ncbi:Pvc16 family protein [Actinomadura sp. 21ATH]|uniref:Pvc16 family protein n=1 Tax=Actinomadura sp. 21ATH TaxID=1735444 RepID=UPI0035BF31AF
MGALFDNLHDVAQVLAEHIREKTGVQDVQPGAPRDVTATTEPAARITLLYTTPQPGHRNDPAEPAGGGLRPPPLSLSCFYLVTTSGADAEDPVAAYHALGQIMTLYHDVPVLRLPLSEGPGSPPGVFTDLGEGELSVCQTQITLDQVDKVWTPMSGRLQPWALFEVAPVQLVSRAADTVPRPPVRPGGIVLGARAGQRPVLVQVTPRPGRPRGRVRLDVASASRLGEVWVGGTHIVAGDPALTLGPAGAATAAAVLDLGVGGPADLGPGTHRLTVAAAGLAGRTGSLLLADGTAGLDAPAEPVHDPATALPLTGGGLGWIQEVLAWPDRGVAAPSELRTLAFDPGDDANLTVRVAGGLDLLHGPISTWRLAGRLADRTYTPYIVLELRR